MIKKLIENMKIINRENGLIQLFVIYSLVGSIIVSLTCNYDNIKEFEVFFLVVLVPLFITQISDKIINNDFKDGFLEFFLTIASPTKIILGRYLCISSMYIISYIIVLPLICLFFNFNLSEIYTVSNLVVVNIIMSVIVSILVGTCNCYFKSITFINFIINIPLILPNLIISGLIIGEYNNKFQLFMILYGIDFIIAPVILCCSSFLIKNIYNIN